MPPLPPGLEGGVSDIEAPPAPSALEEEDEEEEEGGVVEEGCWSWCTGVPSGVGSGEPCGVTLGLLRGLEDRPVDAPLTERDLWLCALVSRALRGGVGETCSVTLRTSKLFLSGRLRP